MKNVECSSLLSVWHKEKKHTREVVAAIVLPLPLHYPHNNAAISRPTEEPLTLPTFWTFGVASSVKKIVIRLIVSAGKMEMFKKATMNCKCYDQTNDDVYNMFKVLVRMRNSV